MDGRVAQVGISTLSLYTTLMKLSTRKDPPSPPNPRTNCLERSILAVISPRTREVGHIPLTGRPYALGRERPATYPLPAGYISPRTREVHTPYLLAINPRERKVSHTPLTGWL